MDKILFVDDEANVLSALERQFRKQYAVSTAMSAARALKVIVEEGPFAVIVSDMQMPDANGVQFLRAAKKIAPDSVRLMLTGNADQKTAVLAVNEGNVFGLLTKPCPPDKMVKALQDAVKHYHSVTAEHDLIANTLSGSVKLLMDMMSMVAPGIFGRTVTIRDAAKMLRQEIEIEHGSNLELAAMLCNLASVTLPPDTIKKMDSNIELSDAERNMVALLPEVGRKLIANIPRLEKVSEIVYYHQKNFDGSGFPQDDIAGDAIPVESRILKILTDLEQRKARGIDEEDAIMDMIEQQGVLYDPYIFKMVTVTLSAADLSKDKITILSVPLSGLCAGQELVSNVETVDGRLLFATGSKVTDTIIERLRNYNRVSKIKEPIKVISETDNDVIERKIAV